jgi:hypothetical protein
MMGQLLAPIVGGGGGAEHLHEEPRVERYVTAGILAIELNRTQITLMSG